MYDVLIVGGGPAGLSAALVLGRCRRRVLVCDTGRPRNSVSWRVSGYLGHDGIKPADFRRVGREQIASYDSVEFRDVPVEDARPSEGGFEVVMHGGERVRTKKLIVATGLVNELPEIPGFCELWGHGVYHCPYCDGWEHRDQGIAVYGRGRKGMNFALELTVWSRDIVLCTDGASRLEPADVERLARHGVRVDERRLLRLEGDAEGLHRVVFRTGEPLPRGALFLIPKEHQAAAELVERLACETTSKGRVRTGEYECTNVPGLYVAGDSSRRVQFAIVAAAEGAMAAFAINNELVNEETA
ncbi:NAD(P)/FAD-dependent oxidoreductase [Salinarimonas soli]|uniref:Thioredoxin reductase n=1 Tax=Salinarimonas soli TaxID=1638099 RepID=A0A5B2VGK2_9HYPH|nr:NAD(P)/FAD-dependent oxidoreductase [Salinarimonas soli]KAA2237640.1 NAD(P)/FAD-dependent oxidoreductase [Salinarimonas soli]